jgi:hypothetical protein
VSQKLKTILIIGLCATLVAVESCMNKEEPSIAQKPMSKGSLTVKGGVQEMVIAPEEPVFPSGNGRDEFVSYCGICHSLLYISNQPNFSRAEWTAEVHKMVEKYGAPVDSVVREKIVDYLMTIKGK